MKLWEYKGLYGEILENFMTNELRICVYYGLDVSFSGGTVMRYLEIVKGLKARHVVNRLGLQSVSRYIAGAAGEDLSLDYELVPGEEYFMHARDRRELDAALRDWKFILRGLKKKIEDERTLENWG